MVVFFYCLGFSVDHEHPVEIIDESYSHRLKPKDESLSELFITVSIIRVSLLAEIHIHFVYTLAL